MFRHQFPTLISTAVIVLTAFGCSDPTAPDDSAAAAHPWLFISEPIKITAAGPSATFISTPSTSRLRDVDSVVVRNVTGGGSRLVALPTSDRGLDPISVPAAVGDRIEIVLHQASGGAVRDSATVPASSFPRVLRTSIAPRGGRLPIDTRLEFVFTEPLDPSTLERGLSLNFYGYELEIAHIMAQPWTVELEVNTTLEPEAPYTVYISSDLRSLSGRSLQRGTSWLLTWGFWTGAAPTFSVDEPGLIAFASDRYGPSYVFTVNPDGSALTRLARGEAPTFSPDGTRIAFQTPQAYASPGSSEVQIIDVDGSNLRILARHGARHPTWSADGQRVAFERNGEVIVIGSDGSGEEPLIEAEALLAATGVFDRAYSPVWSPDGQRIAFVGGSSSASEASAILVANSDGSDIRRLGIGGRFSAREPSWIGDGRRVAFFLTAYSGTDYGPYGESGVIVSVAVDGSERRAHAFGSGPNWSPEGTFLLYSRHHGEAHQSDWGPIHYERIYVVDVDSGRRRLLIPDAGSSNAYSDFDATWFRPRS